MAEYRIQKIMSEQGLCSRRAAEQIINEGRVKLNGHPVNVGDKMNPSVDVLTVDGQRIALKKEPQMYYLALYKPRGYVTTASDELGRKTVMDLVKNIPARLYPVGRLDKDSEGLIFMTNDGEFANAMMHPSGEITKLYRVTVRPHATEQQIVKLSQGVVLDDGTKTLPAVINVVSDDPTRTVMEMTLREGKNREIRRMCEAVGLEVIRLKRNNEGCVKLGMLQPGEYRDLTKQELQTLRAAAAKGRAHTRTSRQQEAAAARAQAGKAGMGRSFGRHEKAAQRMAAKAAGRGGRSSGATGPLGSGAIEQEEGAKRTGTRATALPGGRGTGRVKRTTERSTGRKKSNSSK